MVKKATIKVLGGLAVVNTAMVGTVSHQAHADAVELRAGGNVPSVETPLSSEDREQDAQNKDHTALWAGVASGFGAVAAGAQGMELRRRNREKSKDNQR